MGKEKGKSVGGGGKTGGVKTSKKIKIKKCAGVGTKSRMSSKDTGKSLCKGGKRKLEVAGAEKKVGGKKIKVESEVESETTNIKYKNPDTKKTTRGVHDSNKSGKLLRKVGKKDKEPEVKPEEKKIMRKKRKKIDKGILARRKLERMKKAGFLSPPPRRSAALNASAIMNCMMDTWPNPHLKIKVEPQDSEPEDYIPTHKHKIEIDTKPSTSKCAESKPLTVKSLDAKISKLSEENLPKEKKLSKSTKIVNKPKNKSTGERSRSKENPEEKKKSAKLKSVSKKSAGDSTDSDLDKSPRATKPNPSVQKSKKDRLTKKKKEKKSNKVKVEMKDLIVGRRMASMNASAMMTATYGKETFKRTADPLKMAIEASLREAREREMLVKPATIETQIKTELPDSSPNQTEPLQPEAKEEAKPWFVQPVVQSTLTTVHTAIVQKNNTSDELSEGEIRRKLIENAKLKTSAPHRRSLDKTAVKDGKKSVVKDGIKERKKSISADRKKISQLTKATPDIKKFTQEVSKVAPSPKVTQNVQKVTQNVCKLMQGKKKVIAVDAVTQSVAKVTQIVDKKEIAVNKEKSGTDGKKKLLPVMERRKGVNVPTYPTTTPKLSGQNQPIKEFSPSQQKGLKTSSVGVPKAPFIGSKGGKGERLKGVITGFYESPALHSLGGQISASALSSASSLVAPPPTATVPPTLIPVRSLPTPTQAKPHVGSISSVKPLDGFNYSGQQFSSSPPYSSGYVQTQSTATLPSTVYSSGYMQSVQSTIPTTVYGGGYVQSVQGVQQHNSQYYSGGYSQNTGQGYTQSSNPGGYSQGYTQPQSQGFTQGYSQQPNQPFSYSYPPNYSFQGYPGAKNSPGSPGPGVYPASFQGGYYIAAPSGFPVVSLSSGAQGGKEESKPAQQAGAGGTSGSLNTPGGFIYGPYTYPARVIGPIIALAAGSIPVPVVSSEQPKLPEQQKQLQINHQQSFSLNQKQQSTSAGIKPVLRPSQDGANKPQGTAAPIMAASAGLRTDSTATLLRTDSPQLTDSSMYRSTASHIRNKSTEAGYRIPVQTDSTGYRQILPKDGGKGADTVQYINSARPLQVVGPITGKSPVVGQGLVAAVLPQQQQQQQHFHQNLQQQSFQQQLIQRQYQTYIQSPVSSIQSYTHSSQPSSNLYSSNSSYSSSSSSSTHPSLSISSSCTSSTIQSVSRCKPNLTQSKPSSLRDVRKKKTEHEPVIDIDASEDTNVQAEIVIDTKKDNDRGKETTERLKGSKNEATKPGRVELEDKLKISDKNTKETENLSKMLLKPERQRILSLNNVSVTTKVKDTDKLSSRLSQPGNNYTHRDINCSASILPSAVSSTHIRVPSSPRPSLPTAKPSLSTSRSSLSPLRPSLASEGIMGLRRFGGDGLRIPRPISRQYDEARRKNMVEISTVSPHIADAPNSGFGHPGLPNGLFRLASSMTPTCKSPTKATAKEPKASLVKRPLLVQEQGDNSLKSPERVARNLNYGDPPVLSPQVTLKSTPGSRISSSMARTAADAVKSPDLKLAKLSGPKPVRSPDNKRRLEEKSTPHRPKLFPSNLSNQKLKQRVGMSMGLCGEMERSRLQLKPATSPNLVLERYPIVQSAKSIVKAPRSRSSSSISKHETDVGKRSVSREKVEKKKRESGGKRGSGVGVGAPLIPWKDRSKEPPVNSGGWRWKGEGVVAKVYLHNEDYPVDRITYQCMRHDEGDEEVKIKDCILLASGNRKKDVPFIAKVTALWENPEDGEMMMSILWFYRPEHTDIGRQPEDLPIEVFASKHRDHTSVACIEDKCFVMTFNEYCRYSKFCRMVEEGVSPSWNIVPELGGGEGGSGGYPRAGQLPTCQVPVDRVFLCRKVYDSRCKRMLKNPI